MGVADCLSAPDPLRNACWIAEHDGVSVGASLLLGVSGRSARLVALFVEPGARHVGIARQLIKSCMAFASESRHESIVGAFAQNSESVVPLLRQSGFDELRDNAGWEKRVEERGGAAHD